MLLFIGKLDFNIPMELTSYIALEDEFVPLKSSFNFMYSLMKISEQKPGYNKLVVSIL